MVFRYISAEPWSFSIQEHCEMTSTQISLRSGGQLDWNCYRHRDRILGTSNTGSMNTDDMKESSISCNMRLVLEIYILYCEPAAVNYDVDLDSSMLPPMMIAYALDEECASSMISHTHTASEFIYREATYKLACGMSRLSGSSETTKAPCST